MGAPTMSTAAASQRCGGPPAAAGTPARPLRIPAPVLVVITGPAEPRDEVALPVVPRSGLGRAGAGTVAEHSLWLSITQAADRAKDARAREGEIPAAG